MKIQEHIAKHIKPKLGTLVWDFINLGNKNPTFLQQIKPEFRN